MSIKKLGKAVKVYRGWKISGDGSTRPFDSYSPPEDFFKAMPELEEYQKLQQESRVSFRRRDETKQERAREIYEKWFKDFEERSQVEPVPLERKRSVQYCLHKGAIYKLDRPGYSQGEIVLQLMELEDKERQRFERLRHRFSLVRGSEVEQKRERIPEEVRVAVWRRDEGQCARCGNRERLEYDHIVPISRGGSNTVRNIELLCEICNRGKGAQV